MLDHVIATWLEQSAQFEDYADFERDDFRCTVPACSARKNLHSHHIIFRSHQGPDEPWNRTRPLERPSERKGVLELRT